MLPRLVEEGIPHHEHGKPPHPSPRGWIHCRGNARRRYTDQLWFALRQHPEENVPSPVGIHGIHQVRRRTFKRDHPPISQNQRVTRRCIFRLPRHPHAHLTRAEASHRESRTYTSGTPFVSRAPGRRCPIHGNPPTFPETEKNGSVSVRPRRRPKSTRYAFPEDHEETGPESSHSDHPATRSGASLKRRHTARRLRTLTEPGGTGCRGNGGPWIADGKLINSADARPGHDDEHEK